MTARLDDPVRAGDAVIAALCETSRQGARLPSGAWLGFAKRPLAVLIRQNGRTRLFTPAGATITPEDFEARHPGHLEAFERLA